MFPSRILPGLAALALTVASLAAAPLSLSGIYPHLAMFNNEGECGTGAVVPWANRLWVVTYAPHKPKGSSDKLYEITPDLRQIIRPESIGGTPANRMIHRESKQLFIGPHVIDENRKVRTIPYSKMFGRPTGVARHLQDPAGKVLFATMEEGIYEVDVRSLAVRELWADEQLKTDRRKADLPGYHGKGFYSGQGVYVYANNGEHGRLAKIRPDIPSGVLAEWDGEADRWTVVRRNQFTEVTGPGGISGNKNPEKDPIWTVGWDAKSLILGLRRPHDGWSFYRLPKGSHSYDGAHGWNTEWPRIRDIGEDRFLMTMHGTFWHFPPNFGVGTMSGIRPRSNYLKVVGDFCRWQDRVVLGCDDTAKSEFINKRKAKGRIAAPQSQSNLWFLKPADLDTFGPAIGRGAVWLKEDLAAGTTSEPYLLKGYDRRGLHLAHGSDKTITLTLEFFDDENSPPLTRTIELPPGGYRFLDLNSMPDTEWIRLRTSGAIKSALAVFTCRNKDSREPSPEDLFNGLAHPGKASLGGLVRAQGGNKRTLSFAALDADGEATGYYEMDADLKLVRVNDETLERFARKNTAIPKTVLTDTGSSIVYTDDEGKRWHFPRSPRGEISGYRIAREVATERDLLHIDGTFYELPARNAGGVAKVRPVATHHRAVHDFCSYRGLLIMTGISPAAPTDNPHLIRSQDGRAALWAGAVDDLWKLGKPRGSGGPWKDSAVEAGKPSEPFLMTAYDQKTLVLNTSNNTTITVQIDLHGDGTWVDYRFFTLSPGQPVTHSFPDSFSAYWIRFVSERKTNATALLNYR